MKLYRVRLSGNTARFHPFVLASDETSAVNIAQERLKKDYSFTDLKFRSLEIIAESDKEHPDCGVQLFIADGDTK